MALPHPTRIPRVTGQTDKENDVDTVQTQVRISNSLAAVPDFPAMDDSYRWRVASGPAGDFVGVARSMPGGLFVGLLYRRTDKADPHRATKQGWEPVDFRHFTGTALCGDINDFVMDVLDPELAKVAG